MLEEIKNCVFKLTQKFMTHWMLVDDIEHQQTLAVAAQSCSHVLVDWFTQSDTSSVHSSIECLDQDRCEKFRIANNVMTAV